ncbi:MAG: protein-export chaperone SecB [Pseudomonadota bacterium]
MADEDDKKPGNGDADVDLSADAIEGASTGPTIEFNTDGAAPQQPNGQAGAPQPNDGQPQAGMLAQYIKDLSFENPNAPGVYQTLQTAKPDIQIGINVAGRQVAEDAFEVEVKLEAKSTADGQPVYMVELVYAGLFQLRNLPEDAMQPFLLVEAPRLLFPFARRILSDAVRDGGYPPLTLEPIDFAALYRQRMEQAGGSNVGNPVQPNA